MEKLEPVFDKSATNPYMVVLWILAGLGIIIGAIMVAAGLVFWGILLLSAGSLALIAALAVGAARWTAPTRG